MATISELRKFNIFAGLTDEELERLVVLCEEETFTAGTTIFDENQPAKKMYLLLKGRVALSLSLPNEKRSIVYTVPENEVFAWSALVEPFQTTAQSKAVEDCKVLSIEADKLFPLFQEDCRTGFVIYNHIGRIVANRLKDTRGQLLSLTYG